MKKQLTFFSALSLGLGLSLTSCGNDVVDVPDDDGDEAPTAELTPVQLIESSTAKVGADVFADAAGYMSSRVADLQLTAADTFDARGMSQTADGQEHVRMDQLHNGVRVFGGDVVVHTGNARYLGVVGSVARDIGDLSATPVIASRDALAIAQKQYASRASVTDNLTYSRKNSELVYADVNGKFALVWHVTFYTEFQAGLAPGLWNYFVDAESGALLKSWNGIHTLVEEGSGPGGNSKVPRTWTNFLDVVKRVSDNKYAMDTPTVVTGNMANGTSGTGTVVASATLTGFGDAAVNDAHAYAEKTLGMMKDWYGFASIDNLGFKIRSRVHYSTAYENAFWDGTQMTYGDGAASFFPLSGASDVVGHEINHGFTSFHSNLTYSGQSGGLNEAFSDIAGTLTEWYSAPASANFDLGDEIFKRTGALRYMCNPTADGRSIDNFANYTPGIDVHFSSGIANKAFCLTAKRLASGSATGAATQASVKRAGAAFYTANASFWTAGTTFQQGCQGTLDAATSLGFAAAEIAALRSSWSDVGVTCGSAGGGGGNTAPIVNFTTPLPGATVSGSAVRVRASASDSNGTIAKVVFEFPNGVTKTDSVAPYSVRFNSTLVTNGTYTLKATAFDNLGLATVTTVAVKVAN
jgi:vibriolysin